jgi:methylmalonyl-CoA epimerase
MLKLEHIGIAVSEGSVAANTLDRIFGAGPYKMESVPAEGVKTFFIDAGSAKLELLESLAPDSTIAKHIEKRGEGLHHIAVEIDDVDAHHERLRLDGFAVIPDAPIQGADGKRVFFVHPRDCHGILVEFCQQVRPTWRYSEIEMPHGTVTSYAAGSVEAPPVLLLHDQGMSATLDFDALLPTLERSMHVITFDAPGHGDSRGWPPGTSVLRAADKHARAVLNWYDVTDAAVVVGRGRAAEAAAQVAKSYPELVKSLVLIDPEKATIPETTDSWNHIPALVCSCRSQSLDAAIETYRSGTNARLSVIPEAELQHVQLAEQISGASRWT